MKRLVTVLLLLAGCRSEAPAPARFTGAPGEVRLVTAAPGHFHAGLVQKESYPQVDPVVHVYGPDGPELDRHLAMIEGFNGRADLPTRWRSVVYRGDDWMDRLLSERAGNVVVTAGNNARKIELVRRAVDAGLHVYADKPMIVRPEDFETLRATLEAADRSGVVVNDIMTERWEITSILQRELARRADLFGTLEQGTPAEPAIEKASVHFLAKTVAGSPLVRPAWFLDASQQGDAITDVTTHLVDLVLWQAFPDEAIDYADSTNGMDVLSARTWDTDLTPAQFTRITRVPAYPAFLAPSVGPDSVLHVAANGEFTFRVRGVHARIAVRWGFENPGGGDTHFSRMRLSGAHLVIRQDAEQGFVPTLYVEPAPGADAAALGAAVDEALAGLAQRWPGLTTRPAAGGVEVVIPTEYREGHEAHFARVTERYLADLVRGRIADWERTNLLTKYWVTTRALAVARGGA